MPIPGGVRFDGLRTVDRAHVFREQARFDVSGELDFEYTEYKLTKYCESVIESFGCRDAL